jgi:CRP-like cAMP-binding protein
MALVRVYVAVRRAGGFKRSRGFRRDREGSCAVHPGAAGDRFRRWTAARRSWGAAGPDEGGWTPVGAAEPGDAIGVLALMPETLRTSRVTALEQVRCLAIPAAALRRAIDGLPDAAASLREAADRLVVATFLREVGALAGLGAVRRRDLAKRVRECRFETGEIILRQGDPGQACYVLRSGAAEVIHEGSAVAPAGIGPGSLFGEGALLTDAPRAATVKAKSPSVALEIAREDFLGALTDDHELATRTIELLRLRERPRRADVVEVYDRLGSDGEPITILKDPSRGTYFRLSSLGRFVWERLDGTRNVRDVALEYLEAGKGFAAQAIADVVSSLVGSGFVRAGRLVDAVKAVDEAGGTRWRRFAAWARRVLTWHIDFRNVDGFFTAVYRGGARLLFTRTAQVVLAIVAIAGLAAFIASAGDVSDTPSASVVWYLLVGIALSLVVHEAGHALTTKASGREVRRAGIGWFWYAPMAFVDTSDAWLATRRQRLSIALSGPYATVLFAGLTSLIALVVGPGAAAALWVLALSQYISVLQNLNPLIELDGYYTLVHLADRPNLRRKALGWLSREGPTALRHPSRVRGHSLEALYAVASILYVIGAAVVVVLVYRAVVEHWVAGFLPAGLASSLAWAFGGLVVLLNIAGVAGDLQAAAKVGN